MPENVWSKVLFKKDEIKTDIYQSNGKRQEVPCDQSHSSSSEEQMDEGHGQGMLAGSETFWQTISEM